ncbi:RhsIA family immunity protein [Acinetobacter sp. AYS6]|uniref:RhsIA family immunity protein n=1 Tax=Acinetobacter sp. AYS6 TaxID=2983297 RepID=UPI0021D66073|nr:RhsIA family immunity protein [Acinetobacter sp. AYS6]MCU7696654.1 RhsIA family immunity protein [Acinetobacter sp. AYS6]
MSVENAKLVLENFINQMKGWEEKWGNVLEKNPDLIFNEEGMESRLSELVMIQNEYLSDKALSLKQDRRVTLTFGIPPEYEQLISKENIINEKKIEFYTKNNEGKECRIYTLIYENNNWKIDIMKIDSLDWKSSRQVF